jgi:L-lactate permease
MVMMALVMNDTGMTSEMAGGVGRVAGSLFPVVSPFNRRPRMLHDRQQHQRNRLFGGFQKETAKALGISSTLIAARRRPSVAGLLDRAVKGAAGFLHLGPDGQKRPVLMKCCLTACLIVLAAGIQTLIASRPERSAVTPRRKDSASRYRNKAYR